MEVLHNGCNTCTRVLPDVYTLIPWACGPKDSGQCTYISGKTLVSVLQLLNVLLFVQNVHSYVHNYVQ